MGSRRTEIERHLPEAEIDEMLREAEDEHRLRRIGFVKNLYRGDTIPEAADREGRSPATGTRWAEDWNEGGFEELMPSFGGGRPPKLDEQQQQELIEMLREDQPWKSQEIHRLLREEFGVDYSPNYLGRFLRGLGLSYTKPGPERQHRSADPDEDRGEGAPDEAEGWVVEDDVRTDGGTVGGLFDTDCSKSVPYQPHDGVPSNWEK